jgi:hypothetical protein
MQVGMERNRRDYPDADVVLFQPDRDDAEMFSTNVFSYSDRRRLCEHAYQRTRDDLRRRGTELRDVLDRHGVKIDANVLADEHRTLLPRGHRGGRRHVDHLEVTAVKLDETLDRLEGLLKTCASPVQGRATH